MRRSAAGVRTGARARLTQLELQRPEWQGWLQMLGETERTLHDQDWSVDSSGGAAASGNEPLLQRRTLLIEGERVLGMVGRLAALATTQSGDTPTTLQRYRPSVARAIELLGYAVRQDRAGIGAHAREWQVDAAAISTIAGLAVLPLLRSCGRLLEEEVPAGWAHGYCPICAGWPILAELRGLDRARRLRCGRCGCDWQMPWLCCSYCGERDHRRLGFLVSDDPRDILRVETCSGCRGYLKSVSVLRAIPFFELHVQDLETVELDLIAIERGYARPAAPGFSLDTIVASRPSRPISRFLRHD